MVGYVDFHIFGGLVLVWLFLFLVVGFVVVVVVVFGRFGTAAVGLFGSGSGWWANPSSTTYDAASTK